MSDKYILNEHGCPVIEPDLLMWAHWFEGNERIIKQEHYRGWMVSTVFLGLNHRFGPGEPILWETMVFGGPLNQEGERCAGNKSNALEMHGRWMVKVRELQISPFRNFVLRIQQRYQRVKLRLWMKWKYRNIKAHGREYSEKSS